MPIALRPYQVPAHDALVNILRQHPAALDASDVGVGKTYVAIKVAETLGLVPLVVCPKAVVPMWKDALEASSVPNWAVGNWESLRGKKLPFGRNFFILDEVQRAKGRDTENAKLLIQCAAAGKVLMLSATCASNPLEMKALGATLNLYPRGGFWTWAREHGCKKAFFGGMEYKGGVEGMSRIHGKIFPHRGVRLCIKDIPDFPECDTTVEVLDFGDTRAAMAAELSGVDLAAQDDVDPNNPLTLQLRDRQRTELLKVPLLVEMITELEASGKSVVCFVNFNETIDALNWRLKISAKEFSGRNVLQREGYRQEFQKGKLNVLLVNIAAGGVGLSLHDEHGLRPRVALICPTFSVIQYRQALGRVRRSGGKSKSLQKLLFSAGTIEARVGKLLRAKEINLDALNDSDLVSPPEDTEVKNNLKKPLRALKVVVGSAQMTTETTKVAAAPIAPAKAGGSKMKKLSPSGLKYSRLSPCFENDPGGDKTAADEGTALHEAVEKGAAPATFTDEQKQVMQQCLDYEKMLVALKPVREIIHELHLTEISAFSPSLRNGKADLVILRTDDTAEIVDWKMGRNGVDEAEINDQVKAYAMALMHRYPKLKWVRAHLVSPRRDEISTALFQRAQLAGLQADLANIVMHAERYHDTGLTAPRTDTCLWCVKRHSCPAVAGHALAIARQYDSELVLPAEVHPSKVSDPAHMATMLDVASVMDKWVQSARHHFTEAALNGADIPGYELREKKASRSVDDALSAWAVCREKIPQEAFIEACSVSVPDLEKAWCADAKRGEKGKAREELMEKLIEAGALKQGAPTHYLGRVRK